MGSVRWGYCWAEPTRDAAAVSNTVAKRTTRSRLILVVLHHHHHERSRNDGWTASGIRGRRVGRRGPELGRDDVDAMRGGIEAHVAAARSGLDVLHDMVLVGTILMDDRQRAIRVRREHVARGRIERGAVYAGADRRRRDDATGLVVGDGQQAAATAAEQTVMHGIDGHGDRLLAGRGRPAARDGE